MVLNSSPIVNPEGLNLQTEAHGTDSEKHSSGTSQAGSFCHVIHIFFLVITQLGKS